MSKPQSVQNQRRWLWSLVGVLLLAGVGLSLFTSEHIEQSITEQAKPQPAEATPVAETPVRSAPVVQPSSSAEAPAPSAITAHARLLPPEGTPLLEIFDELDARAKQGDAAAACRLGAELMRCQDANPAPSFGNDDAQIAGLLASENASDARVAEAAEFLIGVESAVLSVGRICRGVEHRKLPNPLRYFHRAGQAGHRRSMVEFLTRTAFNADQIFDDPGLVGLYDADALNFFQALLQAGDPRVLDIWRYATLNDRSPLARLLPLEWRDRRVVTELDRLIAESAPQSNQRTGRRARQESPTDAQRHLAEQLYQLHFANSPLLYTKPTDPFADMMSGKLDRYGCGD